MTNQEAGELAYWGIGPEEYDDDVEPPQEADMSDTHNLAIYQPESAKPQTAVEIRAHVNLIQEVMRAVMKENTHYGKIPGCLKPSLWKPGAEVLFTTFRVSVDPIVEDLSTEDEARFRVTARGTSNSGIQLGSAVGEASSDEEKYKWREVVCLEEWEATPEDRRRLKWKRGNQKPYSIQQIRTNIADCRNTIVKMASKRAYVALALQVTAASDIFTQDIEDLPAEMQDAAINGDSVPPPAPLPAEIKKKEPQAAPSSAATIRPPAAVAPQPTMAAPPPPPPRQQTAPPAERPKPPSPPQNGHPRVISEQQARRFYAIRKGTGWSDEETKHYLREVHGIASDRELLTSRYEEAIKWAEAKDI